jgi:demethylmenaquinone methyltransferase/2-methoxy-6-polyprenyl-1,4-benzoquinol methylase
MGRETEIGKANRVRRMFGRIAPRYDLLNRLMTGGQDRRWRREAIRRLDLEKGVRVIDLGSGTGDIALEIARSSQSDLVIASDFTPEMIAIGRKRSLGTRVQWLQADAQRLPFASNSLDGVISGFLLRNVPDVGHSLGEQHRILASKGRVVSLDTSPPRDNWLKPLLHIHLNLIIPLLGRLIAGDAEAYTYLPESTAGFLTAEQLAGSFRSTGFEEVGFTRRMLGTVGIHWGVKP